jgi:hypothetical protein
VVRRGTTVSGHCTRMVKLLKVTPPSVLSTSPTIVPRSEDVAATIALHLQRFSTPQTDAYGPERIHDVLKCAIRRRTYSAHVPNVVLYSRRWFA